MVHERAEHPELWAFLESLKPGVTVSGVIAAIESFGVFVDLDDGPAHPTFPGVGFITMPELSWHRFEEATDIVQVGERVSCEFLMFDTWNLEARLSLRAGQPDPFQAFADRFVRVADGVEGLVPGRDMSVEAGDAMAVVVASLGRRQRRLRFSAR